MVKKNETKKQKPIWEREPISLDLGHMTPEELAQAILKKPPASDKQTSG